MDGFGLQMHVEIALREVTSSLSPKPGLIIQHRKDIRRDASTPLLPRQ
jgi:hypothetical protein